MMKKFIYIFMFFTGCLVYSEQPDNPFFEAEKTAEKSHQGYSPSTTAEAGQPGNPDGDDDLPIDDYIPLLVIAAVGIIIYTTKKKKKLLS